MRNNSNKLVNQDISIEPLEESNKKADSHLSRLVSRMEWFPVKYHLVDKVALVVFTVLGYYTGKYHLNDDLVFLCFGADVYLNRSFNVTTFWNMRLY
jgi:hypothetical protein